MSKFPSKLFLSVMLTALVVFQAYGQNISTVVGTGTAGFSGDGGPATAAMIGTTWGIVKLHAGNLYVSDATNNRIRKVNPFTGIITTIAGNGTAGYSGDGGPATAASLFSQNFIDVDEAGNIYVCDYNNYRIRKISPLGIITTLAGDGFSGFSGDGGAATAARISKPAGIVVDNSTGNVYFCDNTNDRIRMINAAGIITTITGTGVTGFSGDGGAATAAQISDPIDLCLDASGNLYFSDWANIRVRKISGGIITTIAGTGTIGYTGDGGQATAANLRTPRGLSIDNARNLLYIGETSNNIVRRVDLSTGIITTVVGDGTAAFSGDGGAATAARLRDPVGVNVDCKGNLYIGDVGNRRVRHVNYYANNNPVFTTGASTGVTVCENSSAVSIDAYLAISDADAGQYEWWVIHSNPSHGSLAGFAAYTVAPTSSGTVTPTGLTYTPTPGYTGTDYFQIGIADCAGGTDIIAFNVTINPTPAAITGGASVCVGLSTTLSSATSGGVWSSSNTTVASVGSSTGIVSGSSLGTATISYQLSGGCFATKTITVGATIPDISGSSAVCEGSTISLTHISSGGVWSSSNTALATVGSSTGVVTGVDDGVVTITYQLTAGCYATTGVTVNPLPTAIGGTPNVCVGLTTSLANGTSGGTWTSSNTSVATVGSGSGIVTGVTAGTATITYTLSSGCGSATLTVTVNPPPAAITGLRDVCAGSTTTLSNATPGGAWSSGATGVATVGSSSGIVSGITSGTAIITYALSTGCTATTEVTVYPVPTSFTGAMSVCVGQTTALSTSPSGGTWTSSSTGVATIGSASGIVTGASAGTAVITYTLATGCIRTGTVTVNSIPATISGSVTVCVGSTVTLNCTPSGGTWSSSNLSIGTINTSTGALTGVATGTVTVAYTTSAGCSSTRIQTVNPLPAPISGSSTLCEDGVITLTDATSGGSWFSTATLIATVGSTTGIVTGINPGVCFIRYRLSSTGCTVSKTVTVNPAVAAIAGPGNVCESSSIALLDADPGGVWTSTSTLIATIGSSTGLVTGVAPGTTTISYTISEGCYSTATVTVDANPIVSGSSVICVGSVTTLTATPAGGTWSSSATGVATIGSSSGAATGASAGTTTISYTSAAGCLDQHTLSVNGLPASITGTLTVCEGFTTTLSSTDPGGVWTSSATSVATIGSGTGIVSGVSNGTATITYTLGTGCFATAIVTVNVSPAGISGLTYVCVGSTRTLSDATLGGVWSSSATSTATIGSTTGIATGIAAGTTVISYTLPAGCAAHFFLTVYDPPSILSTSPIACAGSTTTLNATPSGGTWSSSSASVATIGSASGVATGIAAGSCYITYTTAYCGSSTTILTVFDPPATITGTFTVCTGSTTTLSDATAGGVWTSGSSGVATVGSLSGIVTGISAGTAVITYSTAHCSYATETVTVELTPAGIGGHGPDLCLGVNPAFTCSTPGGVWSSSNTSVVTIGSTGIATGISAGTATISYTLGSCSSLRSVTVGPAPITGIINPVCPWGSHFTVSDATAGGTWTSTLVTISGTGYVTTFGPGTATITYTHTVTGCSVTGTFTVSSSSYLASINGPDFLCMGTGTTLTHPVSGGIWASSNTSVATIGSSSGIITPVAPGATTITYAIPGDCVAAHAVTVSPTSTDACEPCNAFNNEPYSFIRPSTINVSLSSGNYYLDHDVTVSTGIGGAPTFTNVKMFIAPATRINVNNNTSLTLEGSHLFGCTGLWQGIHLQTASGTTATLVCKADADGNSTLIEDATTAVSIQNPGVPAGGATYLLSTENTIFNRNVTGIYIAHYNVNSSSYPFLIHNTVFTSRDFSANFTGFPLQWPRTWAASPTGTELKNSYSTVASLFDPPFAVDNPNVFGTGLGYPLATCKSGYPATYGIRLDSVGTNTPSSVPFGPLYFPASYAEIVIGDDAVIAGNPNLNLFDHLRHGIYATNSNFTCVNNAFANMTPYALALTPSADPGGYGINAITTKDHLNLNRLRVYSSPGSTYNNQFYGFKTGVSCSNYFEFIGEHTDMINKNTGVAGSTTGKYGYLLTSAKFANVNVAYNTITNVSTGISFSIAYAPAILIPTGGSYPSQLVGPCNIVHNQIQAYPSMGTSLSNQRVDMGIAVQAPLIPRILTATANLNVSGNTIHNAYNGIFVNHFWPRIGLSAYTSVNFIYLRSNPVTNIKRMRLQYGINHTQSRASRIYNNEVYGLTTAAAANDSIRAFYASSWNSGMELGCNLEESVGRGYEFFLTNPGTIWHHNSMEDNLIGMSLNGAVIGAQNSGVSGNPMSNTWLGSWSSTNRQTYTHLAAATASPFYVTSGGTTNPTWNYADVLVRAYGPGSIYISSVTPTVCPALSSPPYDTMDLFSLIAQQHVNYIYSSVSKHWMGQYALWKSILVDSTIADSSAVAAQFEHMADSMSRYKYLTTMESLLAAGDFDSVTVMLGYDIDSMANTAYHPTLGVDMADGSPANFIVQNYQQFYSLYMKYATATMDGSDSLDLLALAELCPQIHGGVVHQARALYSIVFDDLRIFDDDSCLDADTVYIADKRSPGNNSTVTTGDQQRYALFPNPNDGSFTIQQHLQDTSITKVVVYDAVGRKVYGTEQVFNNRSCSLNIKNYSPGLYLLEITDSKKRIFRLKFVIDK